MTRFAEAVSALAREQSGRVIALLAHRFGDLDLADEAVQDALVTALEWDEIPDNPAGWLYTVAYNRAVDHLRRAASARRRLLAAAPDMTMPPPTEEEPMIVEYSEVGDEHLRLMLLCCHPALDTQAQVALTLRMVGGLSTPEIAAAFLIPEATLAQRIVRAKRKIRDAGIPLSIPAAIDERIEALLTVFYLVFNEGYLSRGVDEATRVDLADEAIRLTRQAHELLPQNAEVLGLLALQLFVHARHSSRLNPAGELVLLDRQDRTRWDLAEIAQANGILGEALAHLAPGPFQLQALIAAAHANARTSDDTDWPAIAAHYRQLSAMTSSPVVALNQAVAVAMADGPGAGLALLGSIEGLGEYHLYWAARAELLLRSGAKDAALADFTRARQLALNPAEQRHLDLRIDSLAAGD